MRGNYWSSSSKPSSFALTAWLAWAEACCRNEAVRRNGDAAKMIQGALGIAKLLDAALNASFTEAVQRDNKHVRTRTFVWMGEAMKSIEMVSRARVYEAIALAVFAGMVVLFVNKIVPLIAD